MLYSRMRAVALLLVISAAALPANGLSLGAASRPALAPSPRVTSLQLSGLAPTTEDCGCEASSADSVMMNDVRVTGNTLRSMTLSDVNGERVTADSLIGKEGKAVVVFLRHLG